MPDRRKVLKALAVSGLAPLPAADWSNPFASQWRNSFLRHWLVEKEYTLAFVEAMPAEHFDFKPTPAQRSYAEQLVHLGQANSAYMRIFQIKPPPAAPADRRKESVRAYLSAVFDYVAEVLSALSEKEFERNDLRFSERVKPHRGIDLFLRAYTHTAHHRGQAVVYLRLKGITPPTWSFEPTA
jgi:uncharacterized damage-inducible protein DinB